MVPLFSLVLPFSVGAGALAWFAVRGLRMYQEVRAVACPDNHEAAAVHLDAPRAAVAALRGKVDYRLTSCSRWPEKRQCNQACLSQIAGATRGCAARTSIAGAARRKNCALCGVDLGGKDSFAHKPVLMSRDRKTRIEWDAVPPEQLLSTLSTHSQICWTCHMSESYRAVRSARPARSDARRFVSLPAAS